ncbi:hypothetical protein [Pseudonocardia alni]|uniref:hypothetical protein n=1 Tax=Pseudonocardia alni TaxID=33907 RepID=UPI002799CB37|nr:hypothetical protein PaSha_10680 [Pseudonocardia alni]
MSTDDRTPSQDEARTVATDADHDPSTTAAPADHVPGPRDDAEPAADPAAASPPRGAGCPTPTTTATAARSRTRC